MSSCEFCNKTLLNKNNLIRHLTTCKKVKKENENTSCEFCNKVLSSQTTLKRHLLTCKVREKDKLKTDEITVLNEKIRYLQDQNKKKRKRKYRS